MQHQGNGASLWRHEKIYVLDWEAFGKCLEKVAHQLRRDGFHPETIVGISKGGLIPAIYLANVLEVPDFQVLGIARNTSSERYSQQQEPELLWMTARTDFKGRSVLLVDDIAGEGKTLALAVKLLQEKGASSIRTAVIVSESQALPTLDYSAVTLDGWTVFPWEKAIADEKMSIEAVEV